MEVIRKKVFVGVNREKLKYFRKSKNITQEELATKLGLKKQNVSGWETGIKSVPFEYFGTIANALEINIEDMCDVVNEPPFLYNERVRINEEKDRANNVNKDDQAILDYYHKDENTEEKHLLLAKIARLKKSSEVASDPGEYKAG